MTKLLTISLEIAEAKDLTFKWGTCWKTASACFWLNAKVSPTETRDSAGLGGPETKGGSDVRLVGQI